MTSIPPLVSTLVTIRRISALSSATTTRGLGVVVVMRSALHRSDQTAQAATDSSVVASKIVLSVSSTMRRSSIRTIDSIIVESAPGASSI